jgi:rSAM/selenodomain-associated transferase 1
MTAAFGPRLVIMVKEPVAGRVKTRLAREAGTAQATRFFRTQLAGLLKRVGRDRRWQTILAVAPDTGVASRMFPVDLPRMPQGLGDLGDRMSHVVRESPAGPLVIIGADVPGIRAGDIAAAFAALNKADAVFGPAGDGGYWLVGLGPRARRVPVFANVRWSTAFALADTRANLAKFRLAEVAEKDDVDDGDDFERLAAIAGRLIV